VKRIAIFIIAAALFAIQAGSPGLTPGAPGAAGMSPERLLPIRPMVEKHIADNDFPGMVGIIARQGKIVYYETFGQADKESGKPMRKDAIFRIYSMTKAITGVAVMTLYEEGRFSLTDPVSNYLPEFKDMKVAVEKTDAGGARTMYTVPAERPITIRDLLRHTSGLSYAGPKDEKGDLIYQKLGVQGAARDGIKLDELVRRLASAPLMDQPGTTFRYGMSIDVLGRLVEVVSGKPLDQFFAERIFQPLHMEDTGFFVPESKWSRLAALYERNPDGKTIVAKDEQQREGYKHKPDAFMGGAGLASTAMDYLRFIQMLLNGGELDGARILSPKSVQLMSADHLGDMPRIANMPSPGYGFGLTFAVNLGPGKTGQIGSAGEYNWGGAAGTSFWIDPAEKLVGVFMIQRFSDTSGAAGQFKRLAYAAIVE